MNIREKLELQKEIDARNADREREFLRGLEDYVEAVHKTIEVYAEAIHSCIDITAQHYGTGRAELLDLLIVTLQAKEQTEAQEG